MERVLIQLFKEFFEKTCLPLVKQSYGALKEWIYFSSILSQDIVDYSKLEKYVHSLPLSIHNTNNEYSASKSPNTKFEFQRKTSLNEGLMTDNKLEDTKYTKVFDDMTLPTSASISSPTVMASQFQISPQSKDPLKSLEATKHILFGLNNLHLMFVEHQYQFEFPKKNKEEEYQDHNNNFPSYTSISRVI
jgi:hypothetical protein